MKNWQGQPHDFYGFNEMTEFSESQFRFVTGWNRTTAPASAAASSAPGTRRWTGTANGSSRFWAPWLDDDHPQPGQARGAALVHDASTGKDIELPNGKPVQIKGELVRPRSRTFIPARIRTTRPIQSGYIDALQGMPEPLRSKAALGDFQAGPEDNAYQVIPNDWVRLAQERWRARPRPSTPLEALGVNVARGGANKTTISARYGNWFGELRSFPGTARRMAPRSPRWSSSSAATTRPSTLT